MFRQQRIAANHQCARTLGSFFGWQRLVKQLHMRRRELDQAEVHSVAQRLGERLSSLVFRQQHDALTHQ